MARNTNFESDWHDYSSDFDRGGNVAGSLGALLVGVGVGAALAMLFTPQSGTEMRNSLGRRYRDALDRVGEQASNLRERGAEMASTAREQMEKVKPFAGRGTGTTGSSSGISDMSGTGTTGGGNTGM